jgi:midasin (ATPase involved in ribosome maturation)
VTNQIEDAVKAAETVIEQMWDSLLHHVRDDAKTDAQALVAQAKDQVGNIVRTGSAALATDVSTVEGDAAQLAGDAAASGTPTPETDQGTAQVAPADASDAKSEQPAGTPAS